MGTTAEKLTYLNTTKGKIKDSINLTGAGITDNDTFRSYATKLRDGLVNVLNNGTATLYNNFPKVSGSGSEITLENTLEAPMKNGTIDGDTFQQTYSGKNLLKNTSTNSGDNNYWSSYSTFDEATGELTRNTTTTSETFITHILNGLKSNTTYTLSFLAKSNGYVNSMDTFCYNSSAQGIKTKNHGRPTTTFQKYIFTFTTASDVIYDTGTVIRFDNNGSTQSGTEAILTIKDVMLVEGEDTDFEPYVGGQASPNPDYPQEIQCVEGIQNVDINDGTDSDSYEVNLEGKNLFDKNAITPTSYFIQDGSIVTSSGNYCISDYIPVIAGQNYTYQGLTNVGTDPYSVYYDNNKEIVSTFKQQTGINTITIPNNVAFVRFSIRNAGGDDNTFMIEYGNQATSYVPYRSPIKLYNGDYITGTPDNWSIVRNNGSVVLNGTESMGYNSSSEWLYVGISQFTSNYKVEPMKSNYFTYVANMGDTSVEGFGINNALSPTHFVFRNLQLTSKNDWTTWLSTHNTEVVYKLATPTTEQITDTYLISQLNALYNAKSKNGQTNISVSGNLPMILEVSALKDEI
jgi:hypothetical protein